MSHVVQVFMECAVLYCYVVLQVSFCVQQVAAVRVLCCFSFDFPLFLDFRPEF